MWYSHIIKLQCINDLAPCLCKTFDIDRRCITCSCPTVAHKHIYSVNLDLFWTLSPYDVIGCVTQCCVSPSGPVPLCPVSWY